MNRKELLILALITFLTVIAWIFSDVKHTREKTSVTEVQLKQITPLTPTFDNDIISKLTKRED